MKSVRRLLRLPTIVSAALLAAIVMASAPVPAFAAAPAPVVVADSVSDACAGIGLAGGDCKGDAGSTQVSNVVKTIINVLSAIVGVAAVIMIIMAGFKYVTSGGDSNNVAGAKNALIYAIVGLIVVALAQVIVHFVVKSAS